MLITLSLSGVLLAGFAADGVAGGADTSGDSVAEWAEMLRQHLEGNSGEAKEACRRAARSLGEIGPAAAAAVPVLAEALSARSVEVRNQAVDALGRIGPAAAASVPAIIEQVDLPPEHVNYVPLALFRQLAARALGRIGPRAREAVPVLEKALDGDEIAYRIEAAVALWKIARHPAALPALTAVIQEDAPRGTFRAIMALEDLGDAAAPAADQLVAALASPHADHRRAAAEVLAAWDVDRMPAVVRLLREGALPEPAAAIYYLGRELGEQRQSVTYNPALDEDAFIAASRVAIREAAPALLRFLSDPRAEVRQGAIRALAEMGLTAGPLLIPPLDTGEPAARTAAIEALQRVEQRLPEDAAESPAVRLIKRALLPKLIGLAEHPDAEVRAAALRGMARFAFADTLEQARPQLRAALRDDDAVVRRYAFETLDRMRD